MILVIFCIVLVLVFIGMRFAMAAYTQKYMKAVAATGETQTLFSSNLLTSYRTDPGTDIKVVSYVLDKTEVNADNQLEIPFEIYNHPPQNFVSINPNDVIYTLTVTAEGNIDTAKTYILQDRKSVV